jgi:non-heme chloroperoxidase
MTTSVRSLVLAIVTACTSLLLTSTAAAADKPNQQFFKVEENVKLEVLDWGGSGRPLVLLAGLGRDAHAFDKFAPKLTAKYHVYGITRRGFGASSAPDSGYSSERLGEDVLAVLNELKLQRPILAGHSAAGSELSYIDNTHPEQVAGLIYLDAAYSYAFYNSDPNWSLNIPVDANELRKKLDEYSSVEPRGLKQRNQELVALLQQFEKELIAQREFLDIKDMPEPPEPPKTKEFLAMQASGRRVMNGVRKYTHLQTPILAIYAFPKNPKTYGPLPKAAVEMIISQEKAQIDAFEKGVPSARVVRLPNATHGVYSSNEADVLREIDQFVATLPSHAPTTPNP